MPRKRDKAIYYNDIETTKQNDRREIIFKLAPSAATRYYFGTTKDVIRDSDRHKKEANYGPCRGARPASSLDTLRPLCGTLREKRWT